MSVTKTQRLTAQQKREQAAAEREATRQLEEVEALKLWPNRLMTNLERASLQGLDINVDDKQFAVRGVTGWNEYITFYFGYLPTTPYDQYYPEGDWEMMEGLERHVYDLEQAQIEAERQRVARSNALAKLTDEDRKVLGL